MVAYIAVPPSDGDAALGSVQHGAAWSSGKPGREQARAGWQTVATTAGSEDRVEAVRSRRGTVLLFYGTGM
ncbi:MAG: hypothetical protein GX158_11740 [Bacteroidales bacterium]|jgi:hypothetical protein|nr:hypothetical protein [Bacteroidales bacterium]